MAQFTSPLSNNIPHNLAQYAFYFMIKGAYLDCICTALAQRVSDLHDNFQHTSSTLYSFCANLSTRFWYFQRSQTRLVLLQSGAPPNWINIILSRKKVCIFYYHSFFAGSTLLRILQRGIPQIRGNWNRSDVSTVESSPDINYRSEYTD